MKKIFSALICLFMLLQTVSITAFASEILDTPELTDPDMPYMTRKDFDPMDVYVSSYDEYIDPTEDFWLEWDAVHNADYYIIYVKGLYDAPDPDDPDNEEDGEIIDKDTYWEYTDFCIDSDDLMDWQGEFIKVSLQAMNDDGDYSCMGWYYFEIDYADDDYYEDDDDDWDDDEEDEEDPEAYIYIDDDEYEEGDEIEVEIEFYDDVELREYEIYHDGDLVESDWLYDDEDDISLTLTAIEGGADIEVYVYDEAGNEGYDWVDYDCSGGGDDEDPEADIWLSPDKDEFTPGESITVKMDFEDNESLKKWTLYHDGKYVYSFGLSGASDGATYWTNAKSAEGEHWFEVVVEDSAGNEDSDEYYYETIIEEEEKTLSFYIYYDANGGAFSSGNKKPVHGFNNETAELINGKYAARIDIYDKYPSRDDATFVGWAGSASGSAKYNPGDEFIYYESYGNSITLYAIWEIEEVPVYAVTYNANGGSTPPAKQTFKDGESVTLSSSKPTRNGYVFLGWAASASSKKAYYFSGETLNLGGDLNLYAVWEKEEVPVYTVTFDANGGSGGPDYVTTDEDGYFTIPDDIPERYGYEFSNWTKYPSTPFDVLDQAYYPDTERYTSYDITLYARWYKLSEYTLTYNANGGYDAPSSESVLEGEEIEITYEEPERDGYEFLGWSTSAYADDYEYSEGDDILLERNMTLYAVWEKEPDDEDPEADIWLSPDKDEFEPGESITVKMDFEDNDSLKKWTLYHDGDYVYSFGLSGTSDGATYWTNARSEAGEHWFEVVVEDSEGNEDSDEYYYETIIIDEEKPTVTISGMKSSYTVGDLVELTFTFRDNSELSKFEVYSDGVKIDWDYLSGTSDSYDYEFFAIDGTNSIEVKVWDTEGNIGYVSKTCQGVKKAEKKIVLGIDNTAANVNGSTVYNDVAPIIVNNRTMLPARFVAESLGASVYWNDYERKVTIKGADGTTIEIYIDSSTAYVNGSARYLDSPAFISNSRTYTPVRFICEALGANVEWNEYSRQVTITK